MSEPIEMMRCPGCYGSGQWESECCNGADGCSCRGQLVPMGTCNVCHGAGQVPVNISEEQKRANCRAIAGLHFLGSGPSGMHSVWPNRGHYV